MARNKNTESNEEQSNVTVFTRTHTANRGVSTYKAEGFPGVILLAKPAFNGQHPETISVLDVPAPAPGSIRAKMTPEEKKAKAAEKKAWLAGLTPQQKAEYKAEQARKALARAEKLAEAARLADESVNEGATEATASAE